MLSTYKTFLMYRETNSAADPQQLVDIKDYSALGGSPEQIDGTTLSNKMRVFAEGVQSADTLEFTANYTGSGFKRIQDLENDAYGNKKEYTFFIYFGGTESGSTLIPTGTDGIFKFNGTISVYADGGAVNEIRNMKISITRTTDITFSVATPGTTCTVTYDANTGTGSVPSQTVSEGSVITLSGGSGLTAPASKVFSGWATSSSAASAEYQGGESYTVSEDITLYAVWADA